MDSLETRCLDAFPSWLLSLADDARALAPLLEREDTPDAHKRRIAAALNYLFKSLDLIPDGLEDLGFIDDAFVLRAAAEALLQDAEAPSPVSDGSVLGRLARDAELVREFLGDDYARLARYVAGLGAARVRDRTVDQILNDSEVREAFLREVREWADSYAGPALGRDTRNLVKLRSFLRAKLPA